VKIYIFHLWDCGGALLGTNSLCAKGSVGMEISMQFSRKQMGIPYILFLLLFVIAPLLVVLYYAVTNGQGQFTMDNFLHFFTNTKTIGTLVYSLFIAAVTTVLCLLIAFPTAYILAKGGFARSGALLMLFVLPMWINFTLRITALKEILDFLEGNLAYHPLFNTVIGMTYDFLPFMILPIYTTILNIDSQLVEAAIDLGASKQKVFWKVVLPLSVPGIISGITMVFLPAMTNYVVLDMVYNSTYIMGSLIGSYFSAFDWHNGSMISTLLLLLILGFSWFSSHFTKEPEEGNGDTVV
jgi:spermidine/putrescine transport system permease protein